MNNEMIWKMVVNTLEGVIFTEDEEERAEMIGEIIEAMGVLRSQECTCTWIRQGLHCKNCCSGGD